MASNMNVSETIASIKNLNDESTEKFNLFKKSFGCGK